MNNRKIMHIMIMAVAACVGMLTSHAAFAQTEKTLPIATDIFPPFEIQQDGKLTGVDKETVEQVLQRMGYIPDIQVIPWIMAKEYAKDGEVAGLFSLSKTPEQEQFYFYSDPLSTVQDFFFKRKEDNISWQTLDDLKNYRVGITAGYTYMPEFMQAIESKLFKQIEVVHGESAELRHLMMLKEKRTDLFICEISVCQYLLKTHAQEFEMIDYINRPIGEIHNFHIGFSKKWPGAEEIVKQFNAELAKFVQEGKRKAIFEKYGVISPLEP